jgi:SAM-dependent MidA family methyltransferase
MSPLTDLLRSLAPLPFRDFMAAALYHPEHGYYASGRAAIGRAGDFITNASVGALFGRLVARQFFEMWKVLGAPAGWTIVEQGAHRGEFARDALDGLREFAPECFAATHYVIVEPAEALRASQIRALHDLPVAWRASVAELDRFTGVHFSNELLDALPVHLAARRDAGWIERYVEWNGERFVFSDGPLSDSRLVAHLAAFEDAPVGFVTEVNLDGLDWIGALAAKMERGFVLAIDYGYTRAEMLARHAGTLSAYAGHAREPDPLARPGAIDLTAHVEFTSLIEHAERAGFRVRSIGDQQRFMVASSRLHFAETPPTEAELRAFKMLMHPALMGAAFKVLWLEKGL